MRVVVLYHPFSDHSGIVTDYAAEFEHYKGKTLDLVSLESIEGADMAELYDITRYPAVLAMTDAGSLQRLWQGTTLPLMDELSFYAQPPQQPISRLAHLIIPSHAQTAA
jgi:hypothetical protein